MSHDDIIVDELGNVIERFDRLYFYWYEYYQQDIQLIGGLRGFWNDITGKTNHESNYIRKRNKHNITQHRFFGYRNNPKELQKEFKIHLVQTFGPYYKDYLKETFLYSIPVIVLEHKQDRFEWEIGNYE